MSIPTRADSTGCVHKVKTVEGVHQCSSCYMLFYEVDGVMVAEEAREVPEVYTGSHSSSMPMVPCSTCGLAYAGTGAHFCPGHQSFKGVDRRPDCQRCNGGGKEPQERPNCTQYRCLCSPGKLDEIKLAVEGWAKGMLSADEPPDQSDIEDLLDMCGIEP